MTTTPPAGQSHYHIILLHPTEPRILLLPEQNGWLLPSFHKEEPTHLSEIIDAMQRQLGIDAIVLYCAYHGVDRENTRQELIYVLEIRQPSWITPSGSQWVGHDTLVHLELTHPEQRTVLATCLRESEEIPPTPTLGEKRLVCLNGALDPGATRTPELHHRCPYLAGEDLGYILRAARANN